MNIEVAPKETEIKADWYNAVLYCQFLNVNGKTGWRMPTLDELDYIYNSKNDFVRSYYWSATEYKGNGAWFQFLCTGTQHYGIKISCLYVRAVRDIK